MNDFFDLVSKIDKECLLKVKCFYSWREGWRVMVNEDGNGMAVVNALGHDQDEVFNKATEQLLERYF